MQKATFAVAFSIPGQKAFPMQRTGNAGYRWPVADHATRHTDQFLYRVAPGRPQLAQCFALTARNRPKAAR